MAIKLSKLCYSLSDFTIQGKCKTSFIVLRYELLSEMVLLVPMCPHTLKNLSLVCFFPLFVFPAILFFWVIFLDILLIIYIAIILIIYRFSGVSSAFQHTWLLYREVGLLSACAYIYWKNVLVKSPYLLGAYIVINTSNTLCIHP